MSEIPDRFVKLREECLELISPVKPIHADTQARKDFLFTGQRTNAGRELAAPYLVYFLMVDLLGFRDLGKWEKVAFSIPIDFNGKAFLIDHRKMGLGVFAQDGDDEPDAEQIVALVNEAVRHSIPYFDWLADKAQSESRLNVANHAMRLFARYEFFSEQYHRYMKQAAKAKARAKKAREQKKRHKRFNQAWRLEREANWIALAAIDAFFSWTEHVFILIGILQGGLTTGDDVARVANSNWGEKFKVALDITQSDTKQFYDRLLVIRRQLRNYIAHGAFGKNGKAFSFHSAAGAVPLVLPQSITGKPRIGGSLSFGEAPTLELLSDFIEHLWSGDRAPAKLYCQESDAPLVLTFVSDRTYERAMKSVEEMHDFLEHLTSEIDRAANMDW